MSLRCRAAASLLGLLIALSPQTGQAQLMKLLSPGDLTQSHAKIEDCKKCHQSFQGVTDTKCLDCHKKLATKIAAGRGTHVEYTNQPCASCHKDHKGSKFNSISLDEESFDHKLTGTPLSDKHAKLSCKRCHGTKKTFSGLSAKCSGCHEDQHKKSLGERCLACHTTRDWKPTRDKAAHKVAMTGKHASLDCADCHKGGKHLDKGNTCNTCHDHPHKGKVQRCGNCHNPTRWSDTTFDHDTCAMGLTGTHNTTPCIQCHKGWQFGGIPQRCSGCHRQRAKHGNLGECGKCHDTTKWNKNTFEHAKTRFPLTGRHEIAECRHCHRSGRFNDLKKVGRKNRCLGCHKETPKHGDFGNCFPCHDTSAAVAFDHGGGERPTTMPVRQVTRAAPAVTVASFPLKGSHLGVGCKACHKGVAKMGVGPTECMSCHAQDDPHRGQFQTKGKDCVSCHREQSWRPSLITNANHAPERFPLSGGHAEVACANCHDRGMFTGAPTECVSCHLDRHAGRLKGTACKECHSIDGFGLAAKSFTARHNTLSFRLEGAHAGVACADCHKDKRQFTQTDGERCVTCHGDDDPHKGGFGSVCQDCHDNKSKERGWQPTKPFDHRETGWALTRSHSNLPCSECHRAERVQPVDNDCASCHVGPHQGALPEDCEACHTTATWQISSFNHATTAWPLRGQHVGTPCLSCHMNSSFVGTPTECADCHAQDRPPNHARSWWECSRCHSPTSFAAQRFDHGSTGFPLRWSHKLVSCQQCHMGGAGPAGTECEDCHGGRRPADHVWQETACASCHRPTAWMQVSRIGGSFIHDGLGAAEPGLRGSHAVAPCQSCHVSNEVLAGRTCADCHQADAHPGHNADWKSRCQDCHRSYPGWPLIPGWATN